MIKLTELGFWFIVTEITIKDNFLMTLLTEKENLFIPTELIMKVIGKIIANMALDKKFGKITAVMKGNIKMDCEKVMAIGAGLMAVSIKVGSKEVS